MGAVEEENEETTEAVGFICDHVWFVVYSAS